MFKKKKPLRSRQPNFSNQGPSQVFSYHASRSVGASNTAPRKAQGPLWSNGNKSASTRPKPPRKLIQRVPVLLGGLAVFIFIINGLVLSRTPTIIALSTGKNEVFLRNSTAYQRAAETLLAASPLNVTKLTINTRQIEKELERQFPELEQVSVVLPVMGRTPTVYIQPSQPALLLKALDGGVYVLNGSGRALMNASQAARIEKLGLPVVEDQTGIPITLGKGVLPSGNIAFIREVVGQLKAKNLEVSSLVLPKGASQMEVRVNGGAYTVKFSLRGDARAEVGSYLAVKAYLEREHKVPSSYIDVRVANRAYYR
jgi:hypothetical protein